MSVDARMRFLRRAAAQRRLAIELLCSAPISLALVAGVAHALGRGAAMVAAVLCGALLIALVRREWRSIDNVWIARHLDAAASDMDDSAALLFADAVSLSNLQRLQQARLHNRLAVLEVDLRPVWPRRAIALSLCSALVIGALAALWSPPPHLATAVDPKSYPSTAVAGSTIAHSEIEIAAPAYTGLPARDETALDAKVPEGSHVGWRLRFDPQPTAAALVFHDGSRVALTRPGADWIGERTLAVSTLYRIALEGVPPLADDRLYRLDAIPDLPPEIRVIEPDKTLTLLGAQQKTWDLAFEASDDYGIARADLTITLAQGTGENIAFKEQTIALSGTPLGTTRAQRYQHTLDLAALGVAKGDDVVVRVAVSDQREPKPNITRSASFILRWPADASSGTAGLEGVVQHTMPAYFRSQRQIIIDSEALLADQPTIDAKKFEARSDSIGVDQKILRLRYGQFLGEESETHAEHAASSGSGTPTQIDALAAEHAAPERQLPISPREKFGTEGDTVAEYGHVHDIAEAATLLDAQTKAIVKSALGQMWQSELHLRQGDPASALPYEHRALDLIKQVQQSTRIYLARVGLELPVPDESRRLSGDRKELADRVGTLAAVNDGDSAPSALWQALAEPGVPDWNAAEQWLRAHTKEAPDALGVLAAIDNVQRDPTCLACRAHLRDLLWPLVAVPAAVSAPRAAPDAAGRAYLDALPSAAGGSRP